MSFCHFDSNTQVSENNTPSSNNSTKEETNVNFISPSNTVLLQIVISNVEIAIIQGKVIWEESIWEWFIIFVYHPKLERKVEFKSYCFSSRHDESFW